MAIPGIPLLVHSEDSDVSEGGKALEKLTPAKLAGQNEIIELVEKVAEALLQLKDGAPTFAGCFGQAYFTFVDGRQSGTLEILGNTGVFFENAGNRVIDSETFELYEPQQVRLTTRDGRIYDLHLEAGVTRLEDTNSNELTIDEFGITHSSGLGITFDRDSEGRITRIVDPRGNELRYGYDAAGDLTSVNDREENTTSFRYGDNHYLEEIQDARGVTPIRNEYGDDGRLGRHIDAFGKVIEYEHLLSENTELVTNRLGHSKLLEYDDRGNVVREVNELGEPTVRVFDDRDNLLSETDPLDNETVYAYTPEGDLETVTDPLEHTTSYTYNARGQVLTTTDPRDKITTNTYDAKGNLETVTAPDGGVTTFTYDPNGNLKSETDAEGGVTTYEYDGRGNQTKRVDAEGNETIYTYDDAGNQLTRTSTRTLPDSSTETLVTRFVYDGNGQLTKTIAADGSDTQTLYDPIGNVKESIDELGRRTVFTYNELGRQTQTDFPDATSETRTYDAEGRIETLTDRGGRVTSYSYDAVGRLTTKTFPDNTTTVNGYDAAGRLETVTNARQHTTTYRYDAAGRRTKIIDALGGETDLESDAAGNQTAIIDPNRERTEFVYDDANRLVKMIFPDSTFRETGYDQLGRRVSETDQAGLTTAFGYDKLGRLLTVTDAMDQVTSYAYDEVGNQVSHTDANGRTTYFEYDQIGRQTARVLPDGAWETKAYDEVGNLESKTDFMGRKIQYEYTSCCRRLVKKVFPDGSEVSFTYTATGRRETVMDARGVTTYSYDDRDRVVEVTWADGRRLEYGWDNNWNRTSITAHVAGQSLTTSFTWDELDRLDTVTDPEGRVYDHGYDANGNRTSLHYPNGVETVYSYDQLNRLENLTTTKTSLGEVLASYQYTLGPAGNRTRIDEHNGTSRVYAYDDLYRLTNETIADGAGDPVYANVFGYDPVGNRETQQHTEGGAATTTSYGYDDRDRLLSEDGTTYSWDDNGNLTAKSGEATYTWDYEHRLVRVDLADGTVVEHTYDPDGVRVRTVKTAGDGSPAEVIDYLVDTSGMSQVVAETDGAGALNAYYVRGDDLLAVIRGDVGGAGGEPRYYHADGLGSIRALTDDAGVVTDRYAFEPFGEMLSHEGEHPNGYLFAGEALDPNAGWYYLRARWMDPAVGRFASLDPLSGDRFDPLTLHKYLYANADPINNLDPRGEISLGGALVVLAIVAILVGIAAHNLSPVAINQRTRACMRRFASGSIAYLFPPRHCYMQFHDGSTLSFDNQGVHDDPAPDTVFRQCYRIFNITMGMCTERCIRIQMQQCPTRQYRFIRFNCCDCVRRALDECYCHVPFAIRVANLGF